MDRLFRPHKRENLKTSYIYTFIFLYLSGINNIWIGYSDHISERTWRWRMTGTTGVYVYQNWGRGQPNNLGNNQDCGAIVASWNGKWNDERCSYKLPAVCEYSKCNINSFKMPVF